MITIVLMGHHNVKYQEKMSTFVEKISSNYQKECVYIITKQKLSLHWYRKNYLEYSSLLSSRNAVLGHFVQASTVLNP